MALTATGPDTGARPLVGSLNARGEVLMLGKGEAFQLPATLVVDAACSRFKAGDTLVIEDAAEFVAGKFVLVRMQAGDHWLYEASERGGMKVLRTPSGDDVIYDPERHAIIGVVTERRERL